MKYLEIFHLLLEIASLLKDLFGGIILFVADLL